MIKEVSAYTGKLLACLCVCLVAAGGLQAQKQLPPSRYTIAGPTKVVAGTTHDYTLSPLSIAEVHWHVSCGGTIISVNTSTDVATIQFDGTCIDPIVAVTGIDDMTLLATLQVKIIPPISTILSPGTIQTSPQLVRNTTIPETLKATPATGGNCGGMYMYQWQYSFDNSTFFDSDDAILDSFPFETPIDQTVYFRRKVTCGTEEQYTGSIALTFIPPINPGAITSPNQSIPVNSVPATITTIPASNGLCASYTYQWEISYDGYTFNLIPDATSQDLTYGSALAQSAFFRRKAKCKFESGYSNTLSVKVVIPVTPVIPPKNGIDSLLQDAGINIATLFNIFNDSVANVRGNPNDPMASLDSAGELNQQLANINNAYGILDSSDIVEITTNPIQDSVQAMLASGSEGGSGNDSAVVFIPMVDDNIIQLYRSTNNFAALDSLTGPPREISLEEASRTLEDTGTVANRGLPGIFPIIIPTIFNILNTSRGAIINGPSLVRRLQVFHYTGTFYFPVGSPSNVRWVVSGGIIVSQNTNPAAGPIYVDIRWVSSFGSPYVALFDTPSGQYNTLPVYFIPVAARVYPASQSVYYGQVPCILQSTSGCNSMNGFTYQYQWQQLDVYASSTNWVDIPGATSMDYQPPALTNGWMMYRCITRVYNSLGGLATTCVTSAASVKLNPVNPGVITVPQTNIQYNTIPGITQTPATGGYTPAGYTYTYTWEYSVNDGPWQTTGTGQAYPNFAIQNSNTRIRRVVQITGVNTGNLPQAFWKATSNILTFTTFYQTADYENRNYIRENVVTVRGIDRWEDADMLTSDKKMQTTVYFDGLSRPVQTVGKGTHYDEAQNQWYDMVQSITYEAGGRVDKTLMPYPSTENLGKFKNNVAVDQPAYYNSRFNEQNAFARVEYDNSPLNRIVKKLAPGNGWVGSNISASGDAEPYNSTEGVRVFSIGFNATDLPLSSNGLVSIYPSLFLIKTFTKDEKNKKVITYADRTGRVILRKVQLAEEGSGLTLQHQGWLCTYNVYDDLGQLRFIIPAKAVKELEANNWVMTQLIADELCTSYQYDDLGRTIAIKTAGKGIEYFVYDKRNRKVFMQDANMRAKSPAEWLVNFYDELNRQVLSGIYKTDQSRDALQAVTESASGAVSYNTTNGGTIKLWGCPLTVNEINNSTVFTQLSFSYYDEYNFAGKKDYVNNQLLAYEGGNVEYSYWSRRSTGLTTGGKTRVMDENAATPQYLSTTIYYDEEGRGLQGLVDNIKGGTDIASSQYHFNGRLVSMLETHNAPGTPYTNFQVLTKYKFDKIGRIVAIGKKLNNPARSMVSSTSLPGSTEDADAGYKIISSYKYNELNKKVKKVLSPGFNNGQGLESIDYEYNLRGWITGINKGYALGEYTNSQWEHYFGMYIGYDNRDGKFTTAQYNGSIAGIQWKSQGDNTPRKYNYVYDNASRLTAANFTQRGSSGESWNATKVDLSTRSITYDENGNLLTLTNMGVLPGSTAPVTLDQLSYQYKPTSNKLIRVDDNGTSGSANGKLGDFKDGANGAGSDDYAYDANGNLLTDQNKSVKNGVNAGITYNYLDKPTLINIQGKGTIKNIYDAAGAKIQKVVTESPSPANGNQTIITTTTYIGIFIYQQVTANGVVQPEALKMITHEEGRIRMITPYNNPGDPANFIGGGIDLPGGKQGVFDYFIKDHLGNVRATVTEEVNKASGVCTMEDANATVKQQEEAAFGNPGGANEVNGTRAPRPNDWTSGTQPPLTLPQNQKVSMLQALAGIPKTGPNSLLRVMAGDKIRAKADYYYLQNPGSAGGNQGVSTLITGLAAALANTRATALAQDKLADITNSLGSNAPLTNFFGSQSSTSAPKAYLNYIFFDEQFNFVPEASGFQRVTQAGNGAAPLVLTEAKAVKNGYVYVYLSNESSEPVYFDNFTVSHERGQLIADDHYYAFGLRITGISSRSVSSSLQKDALKAGFQGNFSEETEEFELSYNEFALRTYDPQIGRWTGIDPYNEFPSPYIGMGNNPINHNDPTGGTVFTAIWAFFGGGSSGAGCAATAGMSGFGYVAPSTASAFTTVVRVAAVSLAVGGSVFNNLVTNAISTNVAASGATTVTSLSVSASSLVIVPSNRIGGTPKTGPDGNPLCREGCGDDFGVPDNSPCTLDLEGLENETNEQLFDRMKDMFEYYCDGVFEDIGDEMVEHFRSGNGTTYTNQVLNNHVKTRSEYKDVLESVTDQIDASMKNSQGDVKKLRVNLDAGPNFNPGGKSDFVFDRSVLALATLVHGTQAVDVRLLNQEVDKVKRTYKLTIQVDIWDDFGVDRCDIVGALRTLKSKKLGMFQMRYKGFIAWWILQHLRGFKPYKVKMSYGYELKGTF
jgi:RHS repeat-associated protein